ncbi:MAG: hypothetical protein JXB36_04840 [Gammaproteobacteria bacterium]|nr:hypothetical protein [Gammaproteobacteria bacterium]
MKRRATLPPHAARRLGALACVMAVAGAALAAGCGQKGPLVRPDGASSAGGTVPPVTPRTDDEESEAEAASETAGSGADGG